MSAEPSTRPALSFAAARALKREIHDAAVDVKRNLNGNPKCVVLTAQQYAALHMIEGGEDLFFLEGRLRMVSDEAIGKPLPDGQWQILDFVPKAPGEENEADEAEDVEPEHPGPPPGYNVEVKLP